MVIKRALIIAAHPDDEILGCGGTISKLIRSNSEVGVAVFTNGEDGRQKPNPVQRNTALNLSLNSLGVSRIWSHSFPDNRLDSLPIETFVKSIEDIVKEFNPDTIFTHSFIDLNQDHRVLSEATAIACRLTPESSIKLHLQYEVLSSTEWSHSGSFLPQLYIELKTEDVENKMKALRFYEHELRSSPHPRSEEIIKAKLSIRGSECGKMFAEAFQVRKILV